MGGPSTRAARVVALVMAKISSEQLFRVFLPNRPNKESAELGNRATAQRVRLTPPLRSLSLASHPRPLPVPPPGASPWPSLLASLRRSGLHSALRPSPTPRLTLFVPPSADWALGFWLPVVALRPRRLRPVAGCPPAVAPADRAVSALVCIWFSFSNFNFQSFTGSIL
jgi:hypothetical protein